MYAESCKIVVTSNRSLIRRGHSTEQAIFEITDAKRHLIVDHKILLSKLYHYDIFGVPFNWFKNYLHNHTQLVKIGSIQSNSETITCGIPQESPMGPLLFLGELPRPEGPLETEPHWHHGKSKETHEFIFSWLSWLAVLLVGAYARRRRRRSRATWRP